ncbi:sulfite exporter TauE/SafE family protein [Acidovorax sp. HDW3]|nr:sulfite exporter TauE/SafE family protein [Acidovorax sp. HDW3]QIL45453.1 sulfite exporter TauE/SafE family protein [Acidovorax sp. HDW3]
MGLAGGPHCLAMCAAPCHAVITTGNAPAPEQQTLQWLPQQRAQRWRRAVLFHTGRLFGYSLAGALAAWAMASLAWLTQQTGALRPLWGLSHVAMLAWGVLMMAQARQPAWLENAGRGLWRRVQPLLGRPGGVWLAGSGWAFMPCGLLYSALLVAALSNGPLQGALSMAGFAVGSGLWLFAGPLLWGQLRQRLNHWRASWGTRLAGLLLFGIAVWALWQDLSHNGSLWC